MRVLNLSGCARLHHVTFAVPLLRLENLNCSRCVALRRVEQNVFESPRLKVLDLTGSGVEEIPQDMAGSRELVLLV